MRRMLRVLGWMGMSLSALLFVATVVLWVRSLGYAEVWDFYRFEPQPRWNMDQAKSWGTRRQWIVAVTHGRLWLGSVASGPYEEFKPTTESRRKAVAADDAQRNFEWFFQPGEPPWNGGTERAWRFGGAGFCHQRSDVHPLTGRPRTEAFTVALPFWMLTVLFALWPALFLLRRLLRRKRYAAGLCPHCGYDLRATPERCPECGREVVANTR